MQPKYSDLAAEFVAIIPVLLLALILELDKVLRPVAEGGWLSEGSDRDRVLRLVRLGLIAGVVLEAWCIFYLTETRWTESESHFYPIAMQVVGYCVIGLFAVAIVIPFLRISDGLKKRSGRGSRHLGPEIPGDHD